MFKKFTPKSESVSENFNIWSNKSGKIKQWLFFVLLIIAVLGVAVSVYFFKKYQVLRENPNQEEQEEVKDIIEMVGKLIELPIDEVPTVATIKDKDKLQDQVFFKNAQNEDKLLAYMKSMKAILYRPSTNKIIEVSPIYIDKQKISEDQDISSIEGDTESKR